MVAGVKYVPAEAEVLPHAMMKGALALVMHVAIQLAKKALLLLHSCIWATHN